MGAKPVVSTFLSEAWIEKELNTMDQKPPLRKQDYLKLLHEQKIAWETLLEGLSEEQAVAPDLQDGWSIKDVVAHLMAWQQLTNARLRAALRDEAPELPGWTEGLQVDGDEDLEAINARIYAAHHDRNWSSVYQDWRSGFQRLLDTARSVPESLLMEVGRFAWLPDDPLVAVLRGTYEHHVEHYEWVTEWLNEGSV